MTPERMSERARLTIDRMRKFLTLAGTPGSGEFPADLLDEPVDEHEGSPTWRQWLGLPPAGNTDP